MSRKIKDYIYFDETLLHSALAQFEKGIFTSMSAESGSSEQSIEGLTKQTKIGTGIGIPIAKVSSDITRTENLESAINESSKEVVNGIMGDYLVDQLISNCNERDLLIKEAISSHDGDFVLLRTDFKTLDFNYLKNITSPDSLEIMELGDDPAEITLLKNQIETIKAKHIGSKPNHVDRTKLQHLEKQIKDYKNPTNELFNKLYIFSKFGINAFENNVLFSYGGGLSICDKKHLRINPVQLSFLNDTNRKVSILGIVSSIKEKTHADGGFDNLENVQIEMIPSMLIDITLSNFGILKDHDRIIKPIAIYFEQD